MNKYILLLCALLLSENACSQQDIRPYIGLRIFVCPNVNIGCPDTGTWYYYSNSDVNYPISSAAIYDSVESAATAAMSRISEEFEKRELAIPGGQWYDFRAGRLILSKPDYVGNPGYGIYGSVSANIARNEIPDDYNAAPNSCSSNPDAPAVIGNPSEIATGRKHDYIQLAANLADFPDDIGLHYDSRRRSGGAMAAGWFSPYKMYLTSARSIYDGWLSHSSGPVYLIGRKEGAAYFPYMGGMQWGPSDRSGLQISYNQETHKFILVDWPENKIYEFSEGGVLMSIGYADGKKVTVAKPNEYDILVSSNFGRYFSFARDPQNQLITNVDASWGRVAELNHSLQYGYQTLASVKYADESEFGYVQNFGYFDGVDGFPLLSRKFNNSDSFTVSWEYDSEGRAYEQKNGLGLTDFHVDRSVPTKQILTSPLGATSEILVDLNSPRAVVYGASQPAGSGCLASSKLKNVDELGRINWQENYVGERVCYDYLPDRRLETRRIEGLAKDTNCESVKQSGNLPDGARSITTEWHPIWRMKRRITEPKRITTWVYNGQPDPLNGDVIVNCAPSSAKLPNDLDISVLCKRYEQSTNDETGELGLAAPVLITRSWSYEYNHTGQILSETGPRQQKTCYAYWPETIFDAEGRGQTQGDLRLVSMMTTADKNCSNGNMDAQIQKVKYKYYNRRGQVLVTENQNGSIEERGYYPRSWIKAVKVRANEAAASSATMFYEYYPSGLLKQVTQPDGSWMHYEYDAMHRLTDIKDKLGNKVHFALDNAGNALQEIHTDSMDAQVKIVSRTYDMLGRLQSEKLGAP